MGKNKKKKQKVKNKTPKIKKINFDYYVGGDLNCCPICGRLMENMTLKYKKKKKNQLFPLKCVIHVKDIFIPLIIL